MELHPLVGTSGHGCTPVNPRNRHRGECRSLDLMDRGHNRSPASPTTKIARPFSAWSAAIRSASRSGCTTTAALELLCTALLSLSWLPAVARAQAGGAQDVPEYEWLCVTARAAFAPRDGAGALVFRGRMWLLGGWNPQDRAQFPRITSNDVWSSQDGAAWKLEKANSFREATFDARRDWEGRHTGGYVVYKNKLWLVGGDANQGHYQNDVWNSADGKAWSLVNEEHPVPWGPRALHYTFVFKDKIWVLGGQTLPQFAAAKEVFYRDIWNTPDGIRWERVTPREPFWPARGMIGGSAVFKNRVWVLGGGTYDTPATPARKFYNDVWSSPDGIRWTCHLPSAPWQPRQYHDVAVFDERLWVLEGWNRGNRNDVWHSADGVTWHRLPDTPWKPRHAASVFVHEDALWVVAGNNMESDVWKLRRKKAGS